MSSTSPRTDFKMKPVFLEPYFLQVFKSETSQKTPSLDPEAAEKEAHVFPRTLRDSIIPFYSTLRQQVHCGSKPQVSHEV